MVQVAFSPARLSKKAKAVKRWEELFDVILERLQESIQQFPHVPAEDKAQAIGKMRADLHQLESLMCSISGSPECGMRRQELDKARSLLSVYTVDHNKLPRTPVFTNSNYNMRNPNDNSNTDDGDLHSSSSPLQSQPHTSIPIISDDSVTTKPFLKNAAPVVDERLLETQRLAADAERLGFATMNDLKRQREQLERARRNLYQTDDDLNQSNRLMTSMMRR
jgi:hypothetical protein